ncbi:ubiquitin carboxyl-terminal hydrolase 5/13 [Nematocida parisii]|nr:ubiquitin carboxyl-terminal hydrolase 5/13 [Nematocida parisii]
MFYCNDFTGQCSFCFRDVFTESLIYCECGTEMCIKHSHNHNEPAHTRIQLTITGVMPDIDVQVETPDENIDKSSIESQVRQFLFTPSVEGIRIKKCTHLSPEGDINIETDKCTECDINSNSWVCIKCNKVLCGRQQYGIEGNGHAMNHYTADNEHSVYLKVQSIDSTRKIADVYCYKCDDMISHDIYGRIRNNIKNENRKNKKSEEIKSSKVTENADISESDSSVVLNTMEISKRLNSKEEDIYQRLETEGEKQIIPYFKVCADEGIIDLGNTCYISSVLQAITYCISATECSERVNPVYPTECERPKECFGCQFKKVFKRIEWSHKKKSGNFSVNQFCKVISSIYPVYVVGTQQDASEYFLALLTLIESYSEMGHFTGLFDCFKIQQEIHTVCRECDSITKQKETASILYIGFNQTVNDLFAEEEVQAKCECGRKKKQRTYLTHAPSIFTVCVGKGLNIDENKENPTEFTVKDVAGKEVKYVLEAAIIYRGTAQAGHYIVQVPLKESYDLGKLLFSEYEKEHVHSQKPQEISEHPKKSVHNEKVHKKHKPSTGITEKAAYLVHDNDKMGIQKLLLPDATMLFYKLSNE